jgi:hypothetical protein
MHLPPPRRERFTDGGLEPVWAAVQELDEGAKHQLLRELAEELALVGYTRSAWTIREKRAVAALREAADILGHSPSVKQYRTLHNEHPEWPADGTIRSWLGYGRWNDCLSHARLDAAADEEPIRITSGPAFTRDEIVDALNDCSVEVNAVPTLTMYLSWARRPDVRRRPGRRPRSFTPFTTLFGGYTEALKAAGLLPGEGGDVPEAPRLRPAKYAYTNAELIEAIQLVAGRLGYPPTVTDYLNERFAIIGEAHRNGHARALPTYHTIINRFGSWERALTAVSSDVAPPRKRGRGNRYSDEDVLRALRDAYAEIGDPFTIEAYLEWREDEKDRDRLAGRLHRRPEYRVIRRRFGGWRQALLTHVPEALKATSAYGTR